MSILTKQIKDLQANFTIYAIGFGCWIIGSLLLVGFTRRAWGGSSAAPGEVLFMFAVAAMLFWTAYYGWINAYVWISRNAAGQKREILESQADQKYRPR